MDDQFTPNDHRLIEIASQVTKVDALMATGQANVMAPAAKAIQLLAGARAALSDPQTADGPQVDRDLAQADALIAEAKTLLK